MHKSLVKYIAQVKRQSVPKERKSVLRAIVDYCTGQEEAKLTFICTHNSRRSHLAQVWASIFSRHFEIDVQAFSGGTEVTEFHPNALAALERAGIEIQAAEGKNPRYQLTFDAGDEALVCYSKLYDSHENPDRDFMAIMTCSEADEACPVDLGSDSKVKLTYQDPKISDHTNLAKETYDQRCLQIASEMYWLCKQIASNLNGHHGIA